MTASDLVGQRQTLGSLIRTRRKHLGWNQTQLGRAVGVDQTTVSTWEAGKSLPSDLHRLAQTLDVSFADLADQALGLLTDVERAIVRDPLLPKDKQDLLLTVYGYLTGRESVQKGTILRAKPGAPEADCITD